MPVLVTCAHSMRGTVAAWMHLSLVRTACSDSATLEKCRAPEEWSSEGGPRQADYRKLQPGMEAKDSFQDEPAAGRRAASPGAVEPTERPSVHPGRMSAEMYRMKLNTKVYDV